MFLISVAKVRIIDDITKYFMLINVNQPHLFLLPCPFSSYPLSSTANIPHQKPLIYPILPFAQNQLSYPNYPLT